VVFAVSAPVVSVPDAPRAPDQPPLAVHDVVFVLVQVRVEAPPEATDVGEALSVSVGAGAEPTTMETLRFTEPPAPVQVNVYVASALSGPTVAEPNVARLPDQAPLAVHDVAFALVHESRELPPNATLVGDALNDRLGAGIDCAVTVTLSDALPPSPVHVSVNVVAVSIAPVDAEPTVGLEPVQPPLAMHDVALALVHDSVVDCPCTTVALLAVRSTVGAAGAGGASFTVTRTVLREVPPSPVHLSV
jgi:hypothetical protein